MILETMKKSEYNLIQFTLDLNNDVTRKITFIIIFIPRHT